MSFLDGALQVVLTLLIIEVGWGIAVLVAWFFHSMIVFYSIGSVLTTGSVIGAICYFYLTKETGQEAAKEPLDELDRLSSNKKTDRRWGGNTFTKGGE
jgi:hypothetical protein